MLSRPPPLGFASGFLAAAVMLMKFGPDLVLRSFGTGPLNILAQRMYALFQPAFLPGFILLFCVSMQVSFLNPPFGPAAFYLKSVAPPHITLPAIFRGFLPFIGIQLWC